MQIRLKKDCTYLTNNLEGLHVPDVKELKGINTLQYTVRMDSDDETHLCSSDGLFLRKNIVLDKNYNPIQTAIANDFRQEAYVSDTFCIFESYDSVLNAKTLNILSSATIYTKIEKISFKLNRLITTMLLS